MVRWLNRLLRYAGVVLAAYWGTIFVLSHLPRSNLYPPLPWHRMDKVLHLGGYATLAFLCAAVWTRRQSLTARQYGLILLGLASYAAIDEVTQAIPGINRNCDPLDWLADTIGAVVGLACFAATAWTAKRFLGWRLIRNGEAALQTNATASLNPKV